MFVQPDLPKLNLPTLGEDRPTTNNTLPSYPSVRLKELGSQIQGTEPYKSVKRGEATIRRRPTEEQYLDTNPQRMRGPIHAMVRPKPGQKQEQGQ